MKDFIIRILIKLLEKSVNVNLPIKDNEINDWLANTWKENGFKQYFRKRDYELLKGMGCNPGEKEYTILLGRRLEILNLARICKEQFLKTKK